VPFSDRCPVHCNSMPHPVPSVRHACTSFPSIQVLRKKNPIEHKHQNTYKRLGYQRLQARSSEETFLSRAPQNKRHRCLADSPSKHKSQPGEVSRSRTITRSIPVDRSRKETWSWSLREIKLLRGDAIRSFTDCHHYSLLCSSSSRRTETESSSS